MEKLKTMALFSLLKLSSSSKTLLDLERAYSEFVFELEQFVETETDFYYVYYQFSYAQIELTGLSNSLSCASKKKSAILPKKSNSNTKHSLTAT